MEGPCAVLFESEGEAQCFVEAPGVFQISAADDDQGQSGAWDQPSKVGINVMKS